MRPRNKRRARKLSRRSACDPRSFSESERKGDAGTGRRSQAAALARGGIIINDDKKEKRRIRERVNDSGPQVAAAIKLLRSRLTPRRKGRSNIAADSVRKNVIFIAKWTSVIYLSGYGRLYMADDADNGHVGSQDSPRGSLPETIFPKSLPSMTLHLV